ncbi:MAG: hypothetical protein HW421_2646 [Ignavibacteria bacterium]|nr:hypothetical protein [Ignavibacteria bacterium]
MKIFYNLFVCSLLVTILFGSISSMSQTQKEKDKPLVGEMIYDVNPDINGCQPGVLKASEKKKILDYINFLRKIHKIKPVEYEFAGDDQVMKSCLVMVANGTMSHNPSSGSQCYTQAAYDGSNTSNLSLGYSGFELYSESLEAVYGWMRDDRSATGDQMGHRRAIINPFVTKIAFGRADGYPKSGTKAFYTGQALKYQDYTALSINDPNLEFVACPFEDYPTVCQNKSYFLTFSTIFDHSNRWNNAKVNFSGTKITMKDEFDNQVSISEQKSDLDSWGSLPNNLQWKAAGLVDGRKYFVTITNVVSNNTPKDYSYWFRLGNVTPTPEFAPPELLYPPDASQDIPLDILLKWNQSVGATDYQVQVSKRLDFKSILFDDTLQTQTYNLYSLESGMSYYWRVQAFKDTAKSGWSAVRTFRTKAGLPAIPVMKTPKNDSILPYTSVQLSWNTSANAKNYRVQINNKSEFNGVTQFVLDTEKITGTTLTLPGNVLEAEKKYYWRVMGTNTLGTGSWSTPWSFTTGGVNSVTDILNIISDAAIYPNPAESKSKIMINLNYSAFVSISIYNLLGSEIQPVFKGYLEQGKHEMIIENGNLTQGTYLLGINTGGGVVVRKFEIVK